MRKRIALGAAIRAIREAQGISISAFAPRVGVTQGYLSNVELGHKNPTVEFLARLASALDTRLDAISYVPLPCPTCSVEELAS